MSGTHPPLVWMDLEMTGLDPATCEILEIATIVTDSELELVAEGPDIVIHQPDHVLAAMGPWCTKQHGESGLTEQVRRSTISLAAAEDMVLTFLQEHCEPETSPLCGNTIGQDRRFIVRYMPRLAAFLHYRSIDVSSVKELCRRWYPELKAPPKGEAHRALDDIRESIIELRFYREHIFRAQTHADVTVADATPT